MDSARSVIASARDDPYDRLRGVSRAGDAVLQRVPLRRGAGDARDAARDGTIRRWRREAPRVLLRDARSARDRPGRVPRGEGRRDGAEGGHRGRQGAPGEDRGVRRAPRVHGEPRQQGGGEGLPRGRSRSASTASSGRLRLAWDPDEAEALATDAGVVAARDPLTHGAVEGRRSPTTACPGRPATRAATRTRRSRSSARSRSGAKHKDATYVFTNVDMFADAKRFKKAVKA